MRGLMIAGALALLCAGCLQQTGQHAAAGCTASASKTWRADANSNLKIEAFTEGPDCAHAVATLIIRDAENNALWAHAVASEHLMTLAQARDHRAMQAALSQWISFDNHTMATTSALPDWPVNAAGPQNGEFPFYPAAGLDRDAYMTLRQNNLPLYCYVQGMESLACLAWSDGGLQEVGVQSVPG
jgi:hypothetical protein